MKIKTNILLLGFNSRIRGRRIFHSELHSKKFQMRNLKTKTIFFHHNVTMKEMESNDDINWPKNCSENVSLFKYFYISILF